MSDKRVLVFGSSGMLGNYLCNMLEQKGYTVERNDISNKGIDITKELEVRDAVYESKAEYVVNCAAYTNVNMAEEQPELAFKVNANAPLYMAKICKQLKIPFIHISTDYVFGDNKEGGYVEEYDKFNPLNEYGKSKLEGEENVLTYGKGAYILRTSWLFGPNATNFISKISQAARKNPELKVVTDEIGCPTYVKDLSEGILLAVENKIQPGIYHVCSSNSLSRYEFAKEILSQQGLDTPILESKLEDFPRKAQVPNISILLNTKLDEARSSEEMLKDYFSEKE